MKNLNTRHFQKIWEDDLKDGQVLSESDEHAICFLKDFYPSAAKLRQLRPFDHL